MQIRLKLIYLGFIFMLHYGQRITQVCFSSTSMDSDYHNAVVGTPTPPQVAFISLMLYNNVSIRYLLPGELQLKFHI